MMMLEHEGKQLLASAGVPVPHGKVIRAGSPSMEDMANGVSAFPVAVKAQVRSGGRGKQGGVRQVKAADELPRVVTALLDTAFGGEKPDAVLIEPWLAIERESYLSVAVDGRAEGYVVMYSPKGGVDIEEGPPPARYAVGAPWNFRVHELRKVLQEVEPDYQWREKVIALAQRLVRIAAMHDCSTIEINPLAQLSDGALMVADAKVVRDEWAYFRNAEIHGMREAEKERADKLLRDSLDMQHMYVRLDGDIGLISGGAGMTMAAMDMIAEHGARPACFLDCSPGPTSTRGYRPAFAMLDGDPQVKVILVSVFGGGTQMQRVANAMKEVMAERSSKKPVVFRLDGTHVDQVPGIFEQFGAHNHARLEEAVSEAVRLAEKAA
ncbi:MAG: ATP-grasp domain-containing protein [Burkholderiales bacterium]